MCHRFIDTEPDRVFSLTVWPIVSIRVIFLRFALTVGSTGNFKCSEHSVSYFHQPLQHWRNGKLIADTLIGTDSQRFTPLLELAAILNLEATANKLLNFSRVVTWHKFGVSSTLQEMGRQINLHHQRMHGSRAQNDPSISNESARFGMSWEVKTSRSPKMWFQREEWHASSRGREKIAGFLGERDDDSQACLCYIYIYLYVYSSFFHAIQHPNMHAVSATVSFLILFLQIPSAPNLFHLELPGFCRRLVQMGSTLLQQSQLD